MQHIRTLADRAPSSLRAHGSGWLFAHGRRGFKSTVSSGQTRHVVVAGCGVAGASAAMHLSRLGAQVTLVDPRPPITATSQYSTECYRNFFMDAALVPFMTRSIDIIESVAGTDNEINLNRRGYAFLTATESGTKAFEHFADTASSYGAGPVRVHHHDSKAYVRSHPHGFDYPEMDGFDLVYGTDAIRDIFPFVTEKAVCMLHARRCGWMDSVGFGQAMLKAAKKSAAQVISGRVQGLDVKDEYVTQVDVATNDGEKLSLKCDAFVNTAGAWTSAINELLAPDSPLPLVNEVHAKVILNDSSCVIPQDVAPFMVWRDQVDLEWDADTSEGLMEMDDSADGGIFNSKAWLGTQPGGQHLRPAGNGRVLLLWEHLHRHIKLPVEPDMPVQQFLDMYPQLCIEGLKAMVPGLTQYNEQLGKDTTIDGGYYTCSPDGRPIVGPHGARNAYVCGGMGTYGLMGSPAAGELVALHVMGAELPSYAGACTWPREDPLTEKPIDLLDDSA